MLYTMIDSPIGELLATGEIAAAQVASEATTAADAGIKADAPGAMAAPLVVTGLFTYGHNRVAHGDWRRDDRAFAALRTQLEEYFAGTRRDFDVGVRARGTVFQRAVWQALRTIPYGHTSSYGTIAAGIGTVKGGRAVGAANGRNPVSIIVPCHRVVRGDGSLTGYAGGVETKRWLLDHERAHCEPAQLSPARALDSA